MLEAAQHGCGQDAREEGQQVEPRQDPDQNVESEDFLAALHANKLIVVTEVAAVGAVVQIAAVTRPAAYRHAARLLKSPTRH